MARVTQIVVTLGRKENDGNYGSFHAEYSETVELGPDDSRVEELKKSIQRAEKALAVQLHRVRNVS